MMHPSAHARSTPDKAAYIMAGSGEVVTYGDLERVSSQGAQLFRSCGLRPGEHVAIWMENNRHFFAIVWAAQRSGLIFTAISSHLSAREVGYILANCDAKLIIASHALVDVVREVDGQIGPAVRRFMTDGTDGAFERWEHAIATMPETPIAGECAGVHMLYSSGTTGHPKGVYPVWAQDRPLEHIEPGMAALRDYFRLSAETIYLSPAPLYHAAPLIFNQLVMFQGGTAIIMERFDAEQALALIERYRVNVAQFVPIMFIRMLKLPAAVRERYDTSSLERAIHAAAPCPVEVKRAMIDWWGPILFEYYSSTENAGATLLDTAQWQSHPGSVGKPLGCIVHILDDEDRALPAGAIGHIYFENPRLNFEYYKEPEKTAKGRNAHNWVTVGDIGYVDDDGYLYLTDRKDFMIISGGVNIYPQEIENLLVGHEQVSDVAVFGVANEEFGQEVRAVVQLADRAKAGAELEAQLIAWCRDRIAHFKAPRSIHFVEALPRLDNGKLYKNEIIARYKREMEHSV